MRTKAYIFMQFGRSPHLSAKWTLPLAPREFLATPQCRVASSRSDWHLMAQPSGLLVYRTDALLALVRLAVDPHTPKGGPVPTHGQASHPCEGAAGGAAGNRR